MTLVGGHGSPGRVLDTGSASWIEDLSADMNFPRKLASQVAGLKSAFAFPIKFAGRVIGVIELFSRKAGQWIATC